MSGHDVQMGRAVEPSEGVSETTADDREARAVDGRGLHVDHETAPSQHSPGAPEGIDHALMGDSAERPREDDDVERPAAYPRLRRPREQTDVTETLGT